MVRLRGQFYLQGFNAPLDASNVDVADLYAENIVTNKKLFYEYDGQPTRCRKK
jgi:hypothetical protein